MKKGKDPFEGELVEFKEFRVKVSHTLAAGYLLRKFQAFFQINVGIRIPAHQYHRKITRCTEKKQWPGGSMSEKLLCRGYIDLG